MPTSRLLRAPLLLAAIASVVPLSASAGEREVGGLHEAWRGCLQRNFGMQAALTSRTLAADSALLACRDGEAAYLSALATSPLVDGDDVARVRPALIQRAKGWLLQRTAVSRPL